MNFGDEYVFRSGTTSAPEVISLNSTHAAICYVYSSSAYVVIAGISDSTITYGSALSLGSASKAHICAVDSTHIFATYNNGGMGFYTKLLAVSGTTVSLLSSDTDVYMEASHDDSACVGLTNTSAFMFQKVYYSTNDFSGCAIATISGSTLTLGSDQDLPGTSIYTYASVAKIDDTHALWVGSHNAYGRVMVATISGTTISYGTAYTFYNGALTSYAKVSMLDSTHAIIVYNGSAVIATIDDTTISFGSTYEFDSTGPLTPWVYSLSASKALIVYEDSGSSGYGSILAATISDGDSIAYSSQQTFEAAAIATPSVALLDNNTAIVAYRDEGNSNYGTAKIVSNIGSIVLSAQQNESNIELSWGLSL